MMHNKNIKTFRRSVKRLFRALFKGEMGAIAFQEALDMAVTLAYFRAFELGLKECGFKMDELEEHERFKLTQKTIEARRRIPAVSQWLREEAKTVKQVLSRAQLWINQYESVRTLAKSLVCGDRKYKWKWNPEKEHCRSCGKLHNKVKRMSQWVAAGILPRNAPNDKLECGGWKCGCTLQPTDEPLSKGPLPRLP